jgi:hypothetical protein
MLDKWTRPANESELVRRVLKTGIGVYSDETPQERSQLGMHHSERFAHIVAFHSDSLPPTDQEVETVQNLARDRIEHFFTPLDIDVNELFARGTSTIVLKKIGEEVWTYGRTNQVEIRWSSVTGSIEDIRTRFSTSGHRGATSK